MRKKNKNQENYLERIPCRNGDLQWETDDAGIVTILVENKGVMNRIAQVCFKKPKISYVHLDEMGSFIWRLLDGTTSIAELGPKVSQQFSDAETMLYERLAKYVQILESYGFVKTQR